MLYLLDANVLIDASRDYYPIDRVPEFWEWLVAMAEKGLVKTPVEVHEEIAAGTDVLADWIKTDSVSHAILLKEEADPGLVSKVISQGYAADLTDVEIVKIGRDPFLISYALTEVGGRTVVTMEASKPNTLRANRRVPDVCTHFAVPFCNTFALVKALNFTTKWKSHG